MDNKSIAYEEVFDFKESIKRNYLYRNHAWLEPLVENEYSPFRVFVDTTQPGVRIRIRIEMEVIPA